MNRPKYLTACNVSYLAKKMKRAYLSTVPRVLQVEGVLVSSPARLALLRWCLGTEK